MMDVADATAGLLERIGHTAAWREDKAERYPDDERNWRSARALRQAASDIAALPDSDPRLVHLARIYDTGDTATIALQTRRQVIARHGFDRADATTDDLLAALVAATGIAETDTSHEEDAERQREARVLRKVAHQGLHLRKSHTREPNAADCGRYLLTDDQGRVVGEDSQGQWMTLTEVEGWLTHAAAGLAPGRHAHRARFCLSPGLIAKCRGGQRSLPLLTPGRPRRGV